MKYTILIIGLAVLIASCARLKQDYSDTDSLMQYVDPYIGSDYHGHVFVGANMPFGAVQVGPDNFHKGWDWCSAYHYSDSIIKGFSHTHLSGTGCADLGDISIMPATGELRVKSGSQKNHKAGYASLYSHDNEKVKAGYYSIILDRYNIKVELTATERVGFHKYTFPKSDSSRIIIDLAEGNADRPTETYIKYIDEHTVSGYRFSSGWSQNQQIYCALATYKPIENFMLVDDSTIYELKEGKGKYVKGILEFKTEDKEEILLKVGISPVSEENALMNITKEIPNWNFQEIVDLNQLKWANQLNKIEIEASDSIKRTFYTALYHTMIAPSLYNDVNGDFRGADKEVYSASFNNYTTFSLWDTYRAANPLFTIIHEDRVNDMINSMLELYKQEGKLPEWHLMGHDNRVMIGYNAVPIIVDAYFKGIRGFDIDLAYDAIIKTAMNDDRGMKYIKKMNYIPYDKEYESVAKAMEYAIYDWGIAQLANELKNVNDYKLFSKRSQYYKQYFDPKIKFFRGKNSDGTWNTPFDPLASSHRKDAFCEGNGWTYLWLVPHDVEGLIELLGGKDKFVEKLDSLFILDSRLGKGASPDISGLIGQYAHGNEPGHHITYLYAYAGQQWKTAEKVREIMHNLYTDKPDGLCGNEDCGQMSAWYIFSALGFYPVNPTNGAYIFGSPILDEAIIRNENEDDFIIKTYNNGKNNLYIQSVKLDGKKYTKSYITHKIIKKGGKLEFWMGNKPNKNFGSNPDDLPKSEMY